MSEQLKKKTFKAAEFHAVPAVSAQCYIPPYNWPKYIWTDFKISVLVSKLLDGLVLTHRDKGGENC